MKKVLLAMFAIGCALPALAENAFPNLSDVLSEVEGKEVQAEGRMVNFRPGVGLLFTVDGGFRVTYAMNRDQLSLLDNCKSGSMETPSEGCKVKLSAEVSRDGESLGLLAFDIELLE